MARRMTERDRQLREEYAEQAAEMRMNEIRPPTWAAWKRARKADLERRRQREEA